jgi:hypothetical protein
MQKSWSEEENELLRKEWPTSDKSKIIELFPNREYKTIKGRASYLGIKKIESFKNLNKLSFLLEESCESFYWLGLLMADGHFSDRNEIKLTMSEKDQCQIDKFCELTGTKSKRYSDVESGGYISRPFYTVSVMDNYTVAYLKDLYAIESNKTKKPCEIRGICKGRFFIPWLAGFFDGDGCVLKDKKGTVNGLRIQIHSSWKENLDIISKSLERYEIVSRSYIDTQGYARLVVFSQENILKLCKLVSKSDIPLLDRKLPFALESLA